MLQLNFDAHLQGSNSLLIFPQNYHWIGLKHCPSEFVVSMVDSPVKGIVLAALDRPVNPGAIVPRLEKSL